MVLLHSPRVLLFVPWWQGGKAFALAAIDELLSRSEALDYDLQAKDDQGGEHGDVHGLDGVMDMLHSI